MSVQTYPKKSAARLSDHFISDEFDCPCTNCTSTLVDSDLVERLERMRATTGPLRINSGYRCANYQAELKLRGYETATGISQHQLGRAADVMSEPTTGAALEILARAAGFHSVGVGHSWVHVDLRDDKDRRWIYTR